MKQYESHWDCFPPAACITDQNGIYQDPRPPAQPQATVNRDNWVIEILPFIDMGVLYDKFAHNLPISSNAGTTNVAGVAISNSTARSVSLPFMLCPTDSFNRRPFNGTTGHESAAWNDNWARGNYAANGGLGLLSREYGDQQPFRQRRADVGRLADPGGSRRLRRELRPAARPTSPTG